MKITIWLVSFLCLLGCDFKQDCERFKEGTFVYPANQGIDNVIIRRGIIQVESSEKGQFKDEYIINWTSECDYQLILQKTNNPTQKIAPLTDTMTVRITAQKGDEYEFLGVMNKQKITGTLIKTE